MSYELFQSKQTKKYYFRLKSSNGSVLLWSHAYIKKAAAKNGVASVQKNGVIKNRYKLRVGKYRNYFILYAANDQEIGRSEDYKTKAGVEDAMANLIKYCVTSKIVDLC